MPAGPDRDRLVFGVPRGSRGLEDVGSAQAVRSSAPDTATDNDVAMRFFVIAVPAYSGPKMRRKRLSSDIAEGVLANSFGKRLGEPIDGIGKTNSRKVLGIINFGEAIVLDRRNVLEPLILSKIIPDRVEIGP